MAQLLIIDDDKQICRFLSQLVKRLGYQSRTAHTLSEGLMSCNSEHCDLVLLDLELPDGNGLTILPDLLSAPSAPEVIILTGTGNIQGAELAFKYGAWDFIPKPLNPDDVKLSITRVLQYCNEKQAVKKPKILSREGIIGESPAMKASYELVAQAAATETSVLITGETGTGKELIARAIHNNSTRAEGSFVVVDCAALPESLIESALFGHEKGAFTGATASSQGLIKQAEKGTLFLDEVGELPKSMQKTFLRILQERRFRPIGRDTEIQVDFRLVAATNRNLDDMVSAGTFRKDLLYRLQSITIQLPPLRERRTDIMSLVMNHLEQKRASSGFDLKGCSPELFQVLLAYDWPGNVRELLNTVDHALATAGVAQTLHTIHLPPKIRLLKLKGQLANENADSQYPSRHLLQKKELPSLREYREAMLEATEDNYLQELMCRTHGKIKTACEISGLSESRLHALLKKYGTPRFRKAK